MEKQRTGAADDRGLIAFLRDAFTPSWSPGLVVPAAALAILLTASNIFILRTMPEHGDLPLPFLAAALVRLGGLIVLQVGILRILTASPRRPWAIDAAYAVFVPLAIASAIVPTTIEKLVGAADQPVGLLASTSLSLILLAPLSAWGVAIASARPLAWRPGPYLRAFGRWLPQLIVWSLVLTAPLALLHARLDAWLIRGAGEWFWPVALFDGPLSALLALVGFALSAAAYRRVTQA